MEEDKCLLFKKMTNLELYYIIRNLETKLPRYLIQELRDQKEKGGKRSHGNQYHFLNRADRLMIIYMALAPEMQRIDSAPMDQLPLLINEEWSCPQMKERVLWRLRNNR